MGPDLENRSHGVYVVVQTVHSTDKWRLKRVSLTLRLLTRRFRCQLALWEL